MADAAQDATMGGAPAPVGPSRTPEPVAERDLESVAEWDLESVAEWDLESTADRLPPWTRHALAETEECAAR